MTNCARVHESQLFIEPDARLIVDVDSTDHCVAALFARVGNQLLHQSAEGAGVDAPV